MREIHYWTDEERTFIIEQYPQIGPTKLSQLLNRGREAIRSVYKNRDKSHKPSRRAWTQDELAILQKQYAQCGPKILARELNRSIRSIERKADTFGLKMDAEQMRKHHLQRKAGVIVNRYNKKGTIDIHAWRRAVNFRDDFTCALCGLRDPQIVVAHHIVPESENAALARDPSNGMTLCPNCHARKHLEMGRQSSGKRLLRKDKELIIDLHSLGYSTSRIANDLGVNDKTVDTYIKRGEM